MPSYADFVRTARPPCWGRDNAYDPNDQECKGCRFEHSCRGKIQTEERPYSSPFPRVATVPIRNREYGYNRGDDDVAAPVPYKGSFIDKANAEIVPEGQSPWERIAKDGATGALRGLFGEFYSFFRRYRIP